MLIRHSKRWSKPGSFPRPPSLSPLAPSPSQTKDGVGTIEQWAVVWRTCGELVVFLAGGDEYDELILLDEVTLSRNT